MSTQEVRRDVVGSDSSHGLDRVSLSFQEDIYDPALGEPIWADDLAVGVPKDAPEVSSLSPAEHRLLEAITFPAELQAGWHRDFNQIISNEINMYVDPVDQERIATVASAVEWAWFVDPGEQLPHGVMLDENYNFMYSLPSLRGRGPDVRNYLTKLLGSIDKDRISFYEGRMLQQVNDVLTEIAQDTPAYQLLHILASEGPASQDVPLTLAERMIREAQEEQLVRRRYGLQEGDSLKSEPDAHAVLQRRIYQLDDEKVLRREKRQTDPRQRLTRYIVDVLNNHHPRRLAGENKITDLSRADNGYLSVIRQTGEETEFDNPEYRAIRFWAQQQNGESIIRGYDATETLLVRLASMLVDPEYNDYSALQLLEEAAKVRSGIWPTVRHSECGVSLPLRAYLHRADHPLYEKPPYAYEPWKPHDPKENNTVMVLSREDMERRIVGRLSGVGVSRCDCRVITASQQVRRDLPNSMDGQYDLCLSVEQGCEQLLYGKSLDREPCIPGYKVVAYDSSSQRWFFQEIHADPYSGSEEVMISSTNKADLVDKLNSIGMRPLAAQLAALEELNLAELVELVRLQSDYTFDTRYALSQNEHRILTDYELRKLVDQAGRLQVQCTGAGVFLQAILNTALPGSSAVSLIGRTIHMGQVIHGHRQTLLSHGYRQYILDSTPYGESSEASSPKELDEPRAAKRGSPESSLDDLTKVDTGEVYATANTGQPQIVTTTLEAVSAERINRFKSVTNRMKSLFKVHFNLEEPVSDNDLYKEILKLKKDADPIRNVLGLVLRFEKGEATAEEVSAAKTYVTNLKAADRALFNRIGIPQYDTVLLDALSGILDDLQC